MFVYTIIIIILKQSHYIFSAEYCWCQAQYLAQIMSTFYNVTLNLMEVDNNADTYQEFKNLYFMLAGGKHGIVQ